MITTDLPEGKLDLKQVAVNGAFPAAFDPSKQAQANERAVLPKHGATQQYSISHQLSESFWFGATYAGERVQMI